MSKRVADHEDGPLKGGHRPDAMDVDKPDQDMGEFEDEFEDEFESEDEILEAGVDGRPDAEREAEEKAGVCFRAAFSLSLPCDVLANSDPRATR